MAPVTELQRTIPYLTSATFVVLCYMLLRFLKVDDDGGVPEQNGGCGGSESHAHPKLITVHTPLIPPQPR